MIRNCSVVVALLLVAFTLLLSTATAARGEGTAGASNIGLTRQEAIKDGERVVRGLWPRAWKHHHKTLHCKEHGDPIVCPPVIFNKRLSAEEIELLFSLIRSTHPYTEIFGRVYIHSAPPSVGGFSYRVERCRTEPVSEAGCWEV